MGEHIPTAFIFQYARNRGMLNIHPTIETSIVKNSAVINEAIPQISLILMLTDQYLIHILRHVNQM